MKEIILTGGYVALVDDSDYTNVSRYKWYPGTPTSTGARYAIRNVTTPEGKHTTISMQRHILQAESGGVIDHRNHNTLDNQRANLRTCTHAQNNAHHTGRKHNTSGHVGVVQAPSGKWVARIGQSGTVRCHLGTFDTFDAAVAARKTAEASRYADYAPATGTSHAS